MRMIVYAILFAAVSMACLDRPQASGTTIYSQEPQQVFAAPGVSFYTTLRLKSTEMAAGAFAVLVKYDTNVLQIERIVPVEGSRFAENLFIDAGSFRSGATRVAGFRTDINSGTAGGEPVCHVVWNSRSDAKQSTLITNQVEKHISANWKTEEVWALPTRATIDSTDTDGDGLPDWWEEFYAGSKTALVPEQDEDGDGSSNLAEFKAGTSPLDTAQILRMASIEITGENVRVVFPSVASRRYRVERSDDIAKDVWAPIQEIVGKGGVESSIDAGALSQRPTRFYRVRILP